MSEVFSKQNLFSKSICVGFSRIKCEPIYSQCYPHVETSKLIFGFGTIETLVVNELNIFIFNDEAMFYFQSKIFFHACFCLFFISLIGNIFLLLRSSSTEFLIKSVYTSLHSL